MSIIIKNLSTNATVEVKYVVISEDGRLVSRDASGCGKKYCKSVAEYITATSFTEDGKACEFTLNEGFECEAAPAKQQRAARKPRKTTSEEKPSANEGEAPAEVTATESEAATASMTDEEFAAFVASLAPMPKPNDKSVTENYHRVLAAGFRCNRKKRQYVHPSGRAIYVTYDNDHVGRWTAVTSADESTPTNDAPAADTAPVVVVMESSNDESTATTPVVVVTTEDEPATVTSREDVKAEIVRKYGEMGGEIFECAARYAEANNKFAPDMEKKISYIAEQVASKVFAKLAEEKPATVDTDTVARIARSVFASLAEEQPKMAKLVAKKAKAESGEATEEIYCEDFDDILQDVAEGFYPYLYGAAGCGKSHTAEQIARKLGLEFFCQTTIQFAHDVRGYGDAAGRFVDTPFFKAFADEEHGGVGGLYFQDEYDRSVPEAAIVLNTALANGYYDFPVIGRVYAHPNFRFMAAGNTRMKGGDSQYVGQPMDASSRDRVIEYEMHYDHRVEIRIAKGDEELVAFMEDVREAIKSVNIEHVVSYRATKYAAHMCPIGRSMEKVLKRKVFATLERDEIAVIYGALNNTSNKWAKAMKKLF